MKMIVVILAVILAGCLSPEQVREQQESRTRLWSDLDTAARSAVYPCKDKKECDKAFSVAKLFVESHTIMRIQYSDDMMISTFNGRNNEVSLKAVKVPGRGDSATIELTAWCRYMQPSDGDLGANCARRLVKVYGLFRPHMDAYMQ